MLTSLNTKPKWMLRTRQLLMFNHYIPPLLDATSFRVVLWGITVRCLTLVEHHRVGTVGVDSYSTLNEDHYHTLFLYLMCDLLKDM